jgi:tetratricopeptide (TPR) repeat protein
VLQFQQKYLFGLVIILIFTANVGKGQFRDFHQVHANGKSLNNKEAFQKYFGNTANAASNIRELLSNIEEEIQKGQYSLALKKFQIALSLEPYIKDSHLLLDKLHSNFSALLYNLGATALAAQHLKVAEAHLTMAQKGHDGDMYNMLGRIASFYLQSKMYDSAKVYFDKALLEAKLTKNSLWLSAAYNNLGIFFMEIGKIDSAMNAYQKALQILNLTISGSLNLECSIYDNLAELAFYKKEYPLAEKYYQRNLTYYESINDVGGQVKCYLGLAGIKISLGKGNEAFGILQTIDTLIKKYNLKDSNIDKKHPLLWKNYYLLTKDWLNLAKHLQKMLDKVNYGKAEKNQTLSELMGMFTRSELNKYQTELSAWQFEAKESEAKARRNLIWTLIVAILGCFVVILLLYYFRNKTKIHQSELAIQQFEHSLTELSLRNKQLEKEKVEKELEFKKGDLSDLGAYLSTVNSLNNELAIRLNGIKGLSPEDQANELRQLTIDLNARILSNKKQETIKENLDMVNKEFTLSLLERFPRLTKSELELCGFFRLNMSNKDIALLKNSAEESVKMSRYRLRKKLGLSPEEDLYRFLSKI